MRAVIRDIREATETARRIWVEFAHAVDAPKGRDGSYAATAVAEQLFKGATRSSGANTVKTWFGIGRFSTPEDGVRAEQVMRRIGEVLGDDERDLLSQCWDFRRDEGRRNRSSAFQHPSERRDDEALNVRRRERAEDAVRELLLGTEPSVTARNSAVLAERLGLLSPLVDGIPHYVQRAADVALADRLRTAIDSDVGAEEWERRLVLAGGPPLAGTTRSLLEVLAATLPDALVLPLRLEPPVHLGELASVLSRAKVKEAFTEPLIVVFVERIERLVEAGQHLYVVARDLLHRWDDGTIVLIVGTISDRLFGRACDTDGRLRADTDILAFLERRTVRYPKQLTPDEEIVALERFPFLLTDDRFGGEGPRHLPAALVGLERRLNLVREALDDPGQYVRTAMVRAGLTGSVVAPAGVSQERLRQLTDRWVSDLAPGRPTPTDGQFDDALEWFTRPVTGPWAIARVEGSAPDGAELLRLDDGIVSALEGDGTLARLLRRNAKPWYPVWLEELLSDNEILRLAEFFMSERGDEDGAGHELLRHLGANGNVAAMSELVRALYSYPDEEAEVAFWAEQSAAAGDPLGQAVWGMVLLYAGRDDEAFPYLIVAAEEGRLDPMRALVAFYERRGDLGEAERWLCAAATNGTEVDRTALQAFLEQYGRPEVGGTPVPPEDGSGANGH